MEAAKEERGGSKNKPAIPRHRLNTANPQLGFRPPRRNLPPSPAPSPSPFPSPSFPPSSSSSPTSCLDMAAPLIICDAPEGGCGHPPIHHLPHSHDRKGKAAVSHVSFSQKQGDSKKHGEFVAQSSSAASSSGTLRWAVKGIRRNRMNTSEMMPVSNESNGWRSTRTNRVIDLESPRNTCQPRCRSHKLAQGEAVHQEGKACGTNGEEEAQKNGFSSKRRRISIEPDGISIDIPEVEGAPTPRAGGGRKRCRRSTQQSTSAGPHQLIEIDDLESPRSVEAQEMERERELEKERQIAEDERMARLLQQEYQSEVEVGDLMRNLRPLQHLGTRMDMNSVPVRAFLTGPGSSSSAQRLRSARFQRATGVGRVRRRGFVTSGSGGRRLHLPRQMNADARMELLATLETLETALHLMHDDRDFNENDYEMLLALDENNDRHTGASLERIQMLPVSTVKATDIVEEACSICLEEPEAGDKIRRLPCMHGFHQQCIDQWLERQSKCPVCKASI